jgi:DNA-binding NarL/FixJ family response regulator
MLKDVPREQLVAAIRLVARGDAVTAPKITSRLIEQFVTTPPPSAGVPDAVSSLSERELDVFRLVARGRSNAEIAAELFLGEATIKTHVGSILTKLDLRDRVQAVVLAYECGLVRPGGSS